MQGPAEGQSSQVLRPHIHGPFGLDIFLNKSNTAIGFSGVASSKPFQSLAVNTVPSFDLLEKTQFVPRYCYEHGKARLDNITDWALEQFKSHYEGGANPAPSEGRRAITKDAIFHYVYGVLHDPAYREKYAQNLKREFPRIPFYPNFWPDWGEALMQLHIGYESVEPWPLARTDTKDEKAAAAGLAPKAILRADKEHGIVVIDSETRLSGVPRKAWDYRLGNLSGLEWILGNYMVDKAGLLENLFPGIKRPGGADFG